MVTRTYSLHPADYVILALTIIISIGIGIACGVEKSCRMSKEYFFVGSRRLKLFPIAISLLLTYEASILTLGAPAEVYVHGASIVICAFGLFVANLLSTVITVPLMRPLKLTSAFQYLELRFKSRAVRLVGVILAIVSNLYYMGIVLYGPAVALEAVTGFSKWITMVLIATAAVFYTALGGIKSVVWSDVIQAFIMLIGIIAVIIKGTLRTGGTSIVWNAAKKGKRLDLFDFNPNPTIRHTFWTLFIPCVARGFNTTFNQGTVQRVSAAQSYRDATLVVLITAPLALFTYLLAVYEGIVIYAFFSKQEVEPLTCGVISNPNQIVPYAMLVLFNDTPGLPGLFIASLCSAALSTVSSGLSSLSVLSIEDIVQPLCKDLSDFRATMYAKFSVVVLGILATLVAAYCTLLKGPLVQMSGSLIYSTSGPLVGIFMLGCFFPSTPSKAALIGGIAGVIMGSVFSLGQNFDPNVPITPYLKLGNISACHAFNENSTTYFNSSMIVFPTTPTADIHATTHAGSKSSKSATFFFSLSYNYTALIGLGTTLTLGLLLSFVFGRNRPGDVDGQYILAITDSLLICLPPPLRRWLKRWGPQFKDGKHPKHSSPVSEKALGPVHLTNIEMEHYTSSQLQLRDPENGGPGGDTDTDVLQNDKALGRHAPFEQEHEEV